MSIAETNSRLQALPLSNIINEFGTPLYVYDGNKIVSQYKRLNDAFSGVKLKVKYALIAVAKIIYKYGFINKRQTD